jgi:hypothetical protein
MPLALAGCATTSVFAPKSSCSDLLDGTWETPVPDAAAPREGATPLDTLKSWIGFGGAQTAGKRTEFERAQAARAIIKRCEERDRAAVNKARRKVLGLF